MMFEPLKSLVHRLAGPHPVEDLTDCRPLVVVAYMDDLLSLETVFFVNHLDERQLSATEFEGSYIWVRLAYHWLRNVEDIHEDFIFLEVLEVEVVELILEAEQGIVDRFKSHGHVSALCVMVVEVHS